MMSDSTCGVDNCANERMAGSAYCAAHTGTPIRLAAAPTIPQPQPPAPSPTRNPTTRQGIIVLLLVVAIGIVIIAVRMHHGGANSNNAAQSYDTAQNHEPSTTDAAAKLLAQRDGSGDLATYSAALDNWAADCTETRTDAAGIVDATYSDEMKHRGPDTSRLEVMQHLTNSVPASAAPTNCASIAAAYLVLVEK